MPNKPIPTRAQAVAAAERFRGLFPADAYARWAYAGGIRRSDDRVEEVVHVVQPLFDQRQPHVPLESDVLGEQLAPRPAVRRSRLWLSLDDLLAAGEVRQHYAGAANGFVWHELFRIVNHAGLAHHVLIASPDNWGMALFAATGPRTYNHWFWQRLSDRGYRFRAGLRLISPASAKLDVPDEEALYHRADVPYVLPPHRAA